MRLFILLTTLLLSSISHAQLLTPIWTDDKTKLEGMYSKYFGVMVLIYHDEKMMYFYEWGGTNSELVKYDMKTSAFSEHDIKFQLNNSEITARNLVNTKKGAFLIFADEIDGKAVIASSDLVNSPDKLTTMYEEATTYKNPFGLKGGGSTVMNTHVDKEEDFNGIIQSQDSTKFAYIYWQGWLDQKDEKNVVNIIYFDENLKKSDVIKYESTVGDDRAIELLNAILLNDGSTYLLFKFDGNIEKGNKSFCFKNKYGIIDFNDYYQIVHINKEKVIKRVDFVKNRFMVDVQIIPYIDGIGLFTIYSPTNNNWVTIPPTYKNGYMFVKNGSVEIDIDSDLPKITYAIGMDFQKIFVENNENAVCFSERNYCHEDNLGSTSGSYKLECNSSEVTIYNFKKDGSVLFNTVIDKEFIDYRYDKYIGSSFFYYKDHYYIFYNDKKHAKEISKLGVNGEVKSCITKIDLSGNIVGTYYVQNMKDALPIATSESVYLGNGRIIIIGRGSKDYQIGYLDLP